MIEMMNKETFGIVAKAVWNILVEENINRVFDCCDSRVDFVKRFSQTHEFRGAVARRLFTLAGLGVIQYSDLIDDEVETCIYVAVGKITREIANRSNANKEKWH